MVLSFSMPVLYWRSQWSRAIEGAFTVNSRLSHLSMVPAAHTGRGGVITFCPAAPFAAWRPHVQTCTHVRDSVCLNVWAVLYIFFPSPVSSKSVSILLETTVKTIKTCQFALQRLYITVECQLPTDTLHMWRQPSSPFPSIYIHSIHHSDMFSSALRPASKLNLSSEDSVSLTLIQFLINTSTALLIMTWILKFTFSL